MFRLPELTGPVYLPPISSLYRDDSTDQVHVSYIKEILIFSTKNWSNKKNGKKVKANTRLFYYGNWPMRMKMEETAAVKSWGKEREIWTSLTPHCVYSSYWLAIISRWLFYVNWTTLQTREYKKVNKITLEKSFSNYTLKEGSIYLKEQRWISR